MPGMHRIESAGIDAYSFTHTPGRLRSTYLEANLWFFSTRRQKGVTFCRAALFPAYAYIGPPSQHFVGILQLGQTKWPWTGSIG
jgi:hypothetical protein